MEIIEWPFHHFDETFFVIGNTTSCYLTTSFAANDDNFFKIITFILHYKIIHISWPAKQTDT